MFTRTAQTLKTRTERVKTFSLPNFQHMFELRKVTSNASNSHYIVVINGDFIRKNDWEEVKVLTEVQKKSKRLSFSIKLSKQYPEYASYEHALEEKINHIIYNESLIPS
jgi:hypothetical protein